jgi:hypothetical protein
MTTPEANAAEEFYGPDGCDVGKCNLETGCEECLTRVIKKHNAEHYLPLLRRWEPNMISMSDLNEINAEIARLEAGMK